MTSNSPSDENAVSIQIRIWQAMEALGYKPTPEAVRKLRLAVLTSPAIQQMLDQARAEGAAEMQEALEPFASYADHSVDEDGWTGPMRKERIVDWFGPSDFRLARAALQPKEPSHG